MFTQNCISPCSSLVLLLILLQLLLIYLRFSQNSCLILLQLLLIYLRFSQNSCFWSINVFHLGIDCLHPCLHLTIDYVVISLYSVCLSVIPILFHCLQAFSLFPMFVTKCQLTTIMFSKNYKLFILTCFTQTL